jgi:hypothetical protein
MEYAAGLPMPATPGSLFWFGHFLSFVFGGVLFWLMEIDPTLGIDGDVLAWQIGTVTIGLSSFGVGYALALQPWLAPRGSVVQWPAVPLESKGLIVGALALAVPVLLFFIAFPGYLIGSMREFGAPEEAVVFSVIIFGVLGFVRPVVLVLLGLYLIAEGRKGPVVGGLLAVVGLGQTFQATLAGGRTAILETLLACVAVMVAFRSRQTRLGRIPLVAGVCAMLVLVYIPTAGQYRAKTGYGGAARDIQTASEYVNAFFDAGRALMSDTSWARDSLEAVVGRLYEPSAFRVMMAARESHTQFGFRGWGDLAFRWVPSFIREKGKDRDQDLMWQQGFKPLESSAETLTLPADLYYRFGLSGVMVGYTLLGVLLGWVTKWCRRHLDGIRFVGLMALGVLVARIYAVDFVHAVWAPVYELPIGMGVAVLVFSGLRASAKLSLTRFLVKPGR